MLCHMKGRAKIVGASLFFVCARDYYGEAEKYEESVSIVSVYLIDLCHMELFEKEGEKDEGFLLGLAGVIRMLREIMTEGDSFKLN